MHLVLKSQYLATHLKNNKTEKGWEQITSMLHQIQRLLKSSKVIFDLIVNTLSIEIDWDQYLNLLAIEGTMVVVGAPEKKTPIGVATLITGHRSLAGSAIGGIKQTQEMLEFCSKHNISSDIECIPIQKVNEAYERVINSDVRYRFVIDNKSL
jgi:uncharacterized zinc-type alcohol dehydrogenase-like protein